MSVGIEFKIFGRCGRGGGKHLDIDWTLGDPSCDPNPYSHTTIVPPCSLSSTAGSRYWIKIRFPSYFRAVPTIIFNLSQHWYTREPTRGKKMELKLKECLFGSSDVQP